jgi:hypothetical protein
MEGTASGKAYVVPLINSVARALAHVGGDQRKPAAAWVHVGFR